MTVEAIMSVVTALVTFIFAELSKKFNIIKKDYIPFQNLTIGFITGIIVWGVGLNTNCFNSIVICVLAAFGAGGFYDLSKTGSDNDEAVK